MSKPPFTGVYTGENYQPYYFTSAEFCSREAYAKLGPRVMRYVNSLAVFTADQIRHKFGPTTINSWSWNGDRQYSGLRLPEEPYYRLTSDHSFGNAIDMVFKDYTAKEVRDYIEQNPEEFPFITFIEEGSKVNWLHISVSSMATTYYGWNPDSIIYWSLDTKKSRDVKRCKSFSRASFMGVNND